MDNKYLRLSLSVCDIITITKVFPHEQKTDNEIYDCVITIDHNLITFGNRDVTGHIIFMNAYFLCSWL